MFHDGVFGNTSRAESNEAMSNTGDGNVVSNDQHRHAQRMIQFDNRSQDLAARGQVKSTVGSSHNKRAGFLATARAMATRCCSPPEELSGMRERDEQDRPA